MKLNPAAKFGLAALALTLILVAAPLVAREPTQNESGRASATREVDLPFDCLKPADGLKVYEGSRYLNDAFPYLLVGREGDDGVTGYDLTPENLGHFLVQAPQEGGHVPAAIRTEEQARAAALLFIPGRLVSTEAAALRVVAAARRLGEEFKYLEVQVLDFRPRSYDCTVRALPQDRSIHPTEAWEVAFTALEMDRYLSLVHVTARITAAGEVTYTRNPLVNGPMTSWQTAVMGEYTEADHRQETAMHAEAERARREYGLAAGPAETFEDLWAPARICLDLPKLTASVGRATPFPESAGGHRNLVLADGSRLNLKVEDDRIDRARHLQGPRLLHRIFQRGP